MVIVKLTNAGLLNSSNLAAEDDPLTAVLTKIVLKLNEVIDEVNP